MGTFTVECGCAKPRGQPGTAPDVCYVALFCAISTIGNTGLLLNISFRRVKL